jgi:hypothetical protein
MPGGSAAGGSLFANADLRNIGLASGQRQQQGFQDLLSMLGQYSGTVVPTTGQEIQSGQFDRDLSYRTTQADRNFGLAQNAEDLAAARFNEEYGPREYSSTTTGPAGIGANDYRYYRSARGGRTSTDPTSLMFRYQNRSR